MIHKEKIIVHSIHVDEDGALAHSLEFTNFLNNEALVTLETTGGYASFLNGKVECHPCSIANMV